MALLVLAACGGRRLALVLGASEGPAFAAGSLYAFNTYVINEVPRINIVSHGFLPFALAEFALLFKEASETGHPLQRRPWRLAGLFLLQGLSSNYQLFYGVLVLCVVLLGLGAFRPVKTARCVRALALPGILAFILFLPVLIPYLKMNALLGLERSKGAGIDLGLYLSTPASNRIWGPIGLPSRIQQQTSHFVGFATVAVALLGLVAALRRRATTGMPRAAVGLAACVATTFLWLSAGEEVRFFGRSMAPGILPWLYDHVAVFRLVRIPERYGLFAMLGIALIAARGLETIVARYRLAGLILSAAISLEHLRTVPDPVKMPGPDSVPAVYGWLAARPPEPIAYLPIQGEGLIRFETINGFFSALHGHRDILGYTSHATLLSRIARKALSDFPSEASLAVLDSLRVRRILFQPVLNFRSPATAADARPLLDSGAAACLELETSFPPWQAGEISSGGDFVLRVKCAASTTEAPQPRGKLVPTREIRARASEGRAEAAFDGRLETSFSLERSLREGDYILARFEERAVTGVSVVLDRASEWPADLLIKVRKGDEWITAARLDASHVLQMVRQASDFRPRVTLGFSLDGAVVSGVGLFAGSDRGGFGGFKIPEIQILEKE